MKKLLSLTLCLLMLCAATIAHAEEPVNARDVITEYTALDLTVYEGKAIYINFLTEWCPYCMLELPDIKTLYETYDPDDLAIVLVHVWDGEDETNTQSIIEEYGLEEMTFYEDMDRSLAAFVGLQGYPASLFIDKDGVLNGAYNYYLSYEQMQAEMEAMGVDLRPEDADV